MSYELWVMGYELSIISHQLWNIRKPSGPFGNLQGPSGTSGDLREPSGTFGNLRKPLETIGNLRKPLKTFRNLQKPSKTLEKPSETFGNLLGPSKTFEILGNPAPATPRADAKCPRGGSSGDPRRLRGGIPKRASGLWGRNFVYFPHPSNNLIQPLFPISRIHQPPGPPDSN